MLDVPMTWVLERDVFPDGDCIGVAASEAGHRVVEWSDEWWASSKWPQLDGPVVFHGSLGNAARIPRTIPWAPGAYCETAQFQCSTWYPAAAKWLLHERWEVLPASRFVHDVDAVMERLGAKDSVFVRPDSPLKPSRDASSGVSMSASRRWTTASTTTIRSCLSLSPPFERWHGSGAT
jgi:hypothetical protein